MWTFKGRNWGINEGKAVTEIIKDKVQFPEQGSFGVRKNGKVHEWENWSFMVSQRSVVSKCEQDIGINEARMIDELILLSIFSASPMIK